MPATDGAHALQGAVDAQVQVRSPLEGRSATVLDAVRAAALSRVGGRGACGETNGNG